MKLRIIQRQFPGYEPHFILQQKMVWFWVQINWSTDKSVLIRKANNLLKNQIAEPDKVIWTS